MKLRVHKMISCTEVEGPGQRFCLWVQGCSIRCPGCAVPWTWKKNTGEVWDVEELAQKILATANIQGVTFLGGEPFDQAFALGQLAKKIKPVMSVMCFTGYLLENLRNLEDPGVLGLLNQVDLLIDGPFQQDYLDLSRPWVGSSNQRYHFLTDHYRHLENQLDQFHNALEIRIGLDGQVILNGMTTSQELQQIAKEVSHATPRVT